MSTIDNPLLGHLITINQENLHANEATSSHDHAGDHGPVLTIGPLSLFQTDGPGEDLHSGTGTTTGLLDLGDLLG